MAKLSFLNSNNIETICNPVSSHSNPTDAEIDRVENLWSVPPGARVLSVGRLKPVKNLSLLIRAFSTVSGHNARLMIVGDGDEKETLISLSKSLGIADRVIFVGFQLNPAAFYQTADLFVLSSKYEGFGNVIVEAMASGTSVVSTNCLSGPSEILEDGKYGLLVAVDDVEALGAAMEFSLRNSFKPALLKRRSAEFSPKIAARKYLDLMGL
jgi:glycosyltransferase involved in cell wall biosynthesis